MNILVILLFILLFLLLLVLVGSFICYRMAFYVDRKKLAKHDGELTIPPGKIYEPHRDRMIAWMKEARELPHTDFSITSFDGLKLCGKYYEYAPGAPIEIMMHGYRGTAERDLCGGIQRCFSIGRSALIIDQRGSGKSEGHVITFGIKEYRDCLAWVDFAVSHFGSDAKLLLTGISMGASTVMIAGSQELPPNVIGIVADCGYSSAKAIIKKVIRQMKLPADLLYPFVRLGAKLYGRFDPEEISPVEALKNCRIPICIVHGEDDNFVPCEMSKINYEACCARKKLVTIPGAGHGLSYPSAPEIYLDALKEFFGPEASF